MTRQRRKLKWLLQMLAVLALSPLHATASATPQEFAKAFPALTPLYRAAQAMNICKSVLALPTDAYTEAILDMGRMYSQSPEATDYLISKCNTMWTAIELDPAKAAQIGRAQKIAALDLLESGKAALPVKIRQYMDARPAVSARPAPYEILNGMASSARELDQALQYHVAAAIATLAATGGGLVITALEATGAIARTSAVWSLRAGAVGMEAALVVTVLSAGVAVSANYLVWWKQESDAWYRVSTVMEKLASRTPDQPLAPLLDEYYEAAERLGYFYSYSLLQADGGGGMPDVNAKCFRKLEKFFKGKADWGGKFEGQTICGDAAAVWIGASQYLNAKYPNNSLAQDVANRLMARGKRTYWSYVETQAFRATQPVCVQTFGASIFEVVWVCKDPVTGALLL